MHTYAHICTHMQTCTCAHTCTHMHMHAHICTHKHTHAFWPCQVLAQSKCYISKIQMSNLVPQWLADDSMMMMMMMMTMMMMVMMIHDVALWHCGLGPCDLVVFVRLLPLFHFWCCVCAIARVQWCAQNV